MTDMDAVLDLDAARNWSAIWRVNGAVRHADLIDELVAAVRGLREALERERSGLALARQQRDRQDAVIRGQDAVIAGLRDVRIVMDPMGTTWRHYNDVGWTMTVCVRRGEAPQFQTRAELEQHVGPTLDVFIAPPIPSPVGVPQGGQGTTSSRSVPIGDQTVCEICGALSVGHGHYRSTALGIAVCPTCADAAIVFTAEHVGDDNGGQT